MKKRNITLNQALVMLVTGLALAGAPSAPADGRDSNPGILPPNAQATD